MTHRTNVAIILLALVVSSSSWAQERPNRERERAEQAERKTRDADQKQRAANQRRIKETEAAQETLKSEIVQRMRVLQQLHEKLQAVGDSSNAEEDKLHLKREAQRIELEIEQISQKARAVNRVREGLNPEEQSDRVDRRKRESDYSDRVRAAVENENAVRGRDRANRDRVRAQQEHADHEHVDHEHDHEHGEHGTEHRDDNPSRHRNQEELSGRLDHMRRASVHLHESGLHELAVRVEHRIGEIERELFWHHDRQDHARQDQQQRDGMDEMMQQIRNLTRQVEELRRDVNRMRK